MCVCVRMKWKYGKLNFQFIFVFVVVFIFWQIRPHNISSVDDDDDDDDRGPFLVKLPGVSHHTNHHLHWCYQKQQQMKKWNKSQIGIKIQKWNESNSHITFRQKNIRKQKINDSTIYTTYANTIIMLWILYMLCFFGMFSKHSYY